MEVFTIILSIVCFAISYLFLSKRQRRPKNFPPGPPGIPLFGNALQLGRESYSVALSLREKYGDVIGFCMGTQWVVYLNDASDIREAFTRPELTGRRLYNGLLDEAYGTHNCGLLASEGKPWQEQRRFCLKTLRDFGFGKKSMENLILDEVTQLVEELRVEVNQPITTSHAFNCATFNVLWKIVAGERYPHNDPRLNQLITLLKNFIDSLFLGIKGLYFLFPQLVALRDKFPFLFPKPSPFKDNLFVFLRKIIQEHKNTLQIGNPRDFIDAYLEEMAKTSDTESSFYTKDNDDLELTVMLMDLFVGGAENMSTTLSWSFFVLALHEQKQEKFYREIQNVVGSRNVTLTLNDRSSLPYVEATIMEIMRISTLATLGAPHSATQDQLLKGYNIPKNTIVLPNLYAAHFRKDTWGDPENFRPERFLSADEKTVIRNKNFIPFGVGKRVCIGETLTKDEVFLFLTNLCQQFRIEMPVGEPKHTLKFHPGAIPHPEPHRIVLRGRNK